MSEELAINVFRNGISLILQLSLPMLLAALLVGLIIAVFQATTQIQEQTLAFVPKMIAIFLVLMVAGPWLLKSMVDFTVWVFNLIETIV